MSTLQIVAATAQQYQQQYEAGNISASEFKELLEDLQIQGHIYQTAAELAQDEEYRAILMGIVQVAGSL
jgi:hypothetical protein